MGQQLQSNPFDGLAIDAVVAGLKDAFAGQAPQVDNDTLRDAFGEIHKRMQAAKEEASKAVIEEGTKYLEENAKRDEVTVTESGLQYEVIAEGDGETPVAASTVRVHYHGTLINGTTFDSSYERGQPAGGERRVDDQLRAICCNDAWSTICSWYGVPDCATL